MLLRSAGMRLLLLDGCRCTRLSSAGSKEMFSQAFIAARVSNQQGRSKHERQALTHLDGRLRVVLSPAVSKAGDTVRDHHSLPERLVAACYNQYRCGSRGIWCGSFNSQRDVTSLG